MVSGNVDFSARQNQQTASPIIFRTRSRVDDATPQGRPVAAADEGTRMVADRRSLAWPPASWPSWLIRSAVVARSRERVPDVDAGMTSGGAAKRRSHLRLLPLLTSPHRCFAGRVAGRPVSKLRTAGGAVEGRRTARRCPTAAPVRLAGCIVRLRAFRWESAESRPLRAISARFRHPQRRALP